MTETQEIALLRFFSKPLVGLCGTIASIVGLILAIFFFFAAKSSKELTFSVHPIKAAVVKMGQASRLAVTFDGKNINRDITAVRIALWNRGKKSIRMEAILKPIIIYTSNGGPILEARIINTTRDIVGMTLEKTELDKGKVGVSWKIMENDDGSSIQLIYEGGPETEFKIEG